jgi:hypothetical protein
VASCEHEASGAEAAGIDLTLGPLKVCQATSCGQGVPSATKYPGEPLLTTVAQIRRLNTVAMLQRRCIPLLNLRASARLCAGTFGALT